MCRFPFVKDGTGHGCGQCVPCRINRRRTWAARMMWESKLSKVNSFATLTYSEEMLPGPSLVPRDLQLWLKRLRYAIEPDRFRFFAVGEYGDISERPHFHVALFGFPPCVFGRSRFPKSGNGGCCPFCDVIRDTWSFGHVVLGTLTFESANYIAQYVTKKMTKADDERLSGRHPEFSRMSMRQGIGAGYASALAGGMLQAGFAERDVDVPESLRVGSRPVPLGRFMRQKLRSAVGRSEETPPVVLALLEEKLLVLRARAERLASDSRGSKALERKIFQKLLSDEHYGLAESKIARFKMKKGGTL